MVEQMTRLLLVVEHEATRRESLRDWLAEHGYRVEAAAHGEEALEIIGKHDCALVLLDVELPGKDGIEVLREARAKKPQLKVIINTDCPSVKTAVQAMKEGAVDYLPKPLDPDLLDRLIRRTLALGEAEIGQRVTGNVIARVPVIKEKKEVNLSHMGWEYIDAYLNSDKKKGKEC